MLPYDYQLMLENKYSKSNIRTYIMNDIRECNELMDKLHICTMDVIEWAKKPHYKSKHASLAVLREMEPEDITNLLVDMMSMLLTQSYQMEITSAVGLVAGFMPWEDYLTQIKRASELIFHLANCDIIDMAPAYLSETETILLTNKYNIGGDTAKYIEMSKFTPPMVCMPQPVKSTRDSGYLTKQRFALLKSKHQHNYPVNLEAINKFNQTPLTLDIDFLKAVEDSIDMGVGDTVDVEKREKAFKKYQMETNEVCMDIVRAGNEFFETHFWCGRGRTYSRGYHINSQGNSYRKAMINFAEAAPMDNSVNDYAEYF